MALIFVNNEPQALDKTPETWGELLHRLDEHASRSGVILSAARFDGVEEPSFREPAVTARTLKDVGRVDVHMAMPAAFLRECLLEAIQPLQETADTALRLATLFRGRDVSAGHEGLRTIAADLSAVAVLADMLSGPLAIDLSALSDEGFTAAQHLQQLGTTLDAMVEAQEAQDWLTVADLLEYDLEPAIRRWAALLTMLSCRLQ